MNTRLSACLAAALLACPAAFASVTYSFNFAPTPNPAANFSDFSFALTFPDFVTVTGMEPLALPGLPTGLGFNATRAGTNAGGTWAFDGDGGLILSGDTTVFSADSFILLTGNGDYLTHTGTYNGTLFGNAELHGFRGTGSVTVTEAASVPEPSLLLLLGGGLIALAVLLRRRR